MKPFHSNHHVGKLIYPLNLIKGLTRAGIPVQKFMDKSMLKHFDHHNPEKMIPIHVMYDFFEVVKKEQCIDNMAKTYCNQYRLEQIGAYGQLLASSKMILPFIQNIIKYQKSCLTKQNSMLIIQDKRVYFSSKSDSTNCVGQNFIDQVTLGMYLRTLKHSNNKDWSPIEIHIMGDDTSLIENVLPNHTAKILLNQNRYGMVFDTTTLSKPILFDASDKSYTKDLKRPPLLLSTKINQLFDLMHSHYLPTLSQVGGFFGTSASSIKRSLETEKLTYSILLQRWRFMKAVELLTQTNLKINEISDQLFYSDSSNFVRAFSRWSGNSPKTFR